MCALPAHPPLPERGGDHRASIAKLADTVAGIATADPGADAQKTQAIKPIEWVSRADALGVGVIAQDIADVAASLDRPFEDWSSAEIALDDFVRQAGPDRDADLITLFCRIEGRRLQLLRPTSIGLAAQRVVLPQTR